MTIWYCLTAVRALSLVGLPAKLQVQLHNIKKQVPTSHETRRFHDNHQPVHVVKRNRYLL
jgi:hypothetical protein